MIFYHNVSALAASQYHNSQADLISLESQSDRFLAYQISFKKLTWQAKLIWQAKKLSDLLSNLIWQDQNLSDWTKLILTGTLNLSVKLRTFQISLESQFIKYLIFMVFLSKFWACQAKNLSVWLSKLLRSLLGSNSPSSPAGSAMANSTELGLDYRRRVLPLTQAMGPDWFPCGRLYAKKLGFWAPSQHRKLFTSKQLGSYLLSEALSTIFIYLRKGMNHIYPPLPCRAKGFVLCLISPLTIFFEFI